MPFDIKDRLQIKLPTEAVLLALGAAFLFLPTREFVAFLSLVIIAWLRGIIIVSSWIKKPQIIRKGV